MSRSKLRPRLRVLSLEARDVPTLFGAIDLGQLADAPTAVFDPGTAPPAAITFDGGVVTATGTDDADVIRFDLAGPHLRPVLRPRRDQRRPSGPRPGDHHGRRRDRPARRRREPPPAVLRGRPGGPGGRPAPGRERHGRQHDPQDDGRRGRVRQRRPARRARGSTSSAGTSATTRSTAGPGTTSLDGRADNDLVHGEAGNDRWTAGPGTTPSWAATGTTPSSAGSAPTCSAAGPGTTRCRRRRAGHPARRERQRRAPRRTTGTTSCRAGRGTTRSTAGPGTTPWRARDGNDGLFGGPGRDYLIGGAGIDRFLRWVAPGNQTTVQDKAANESLTTFKGTTSVTSDPQASGPTLRYPPGEWTEVEIEAADAGLGWLHAETRATPGCCGSRAGGT